MGAGCCRARVLPGPGHHHAPGAPPRPTWGPVWGPNGTDSIADLRPGDKFRFNREPFMRQHLVVPEKAFAAMTQPQGVHNPAFTSDCGGLAVRPFLPSLPTPPPSPSPAPVPPPRKKRRGAGRPHLPQGPPPLPPSRTRGGSRTRGIGVAVAGEDADEESDLNTDPNDSILSPAHTMELLQRMAKVEARLGKPGHRARSMDSLDLDALDPRSSRSLPGRGSFTSTSFTPESDGPRSLDCLDLHREGVVGVAAFTLQSWEERECTRSTSPALSNSARLLSPRQWRPLSPTSDTTTSTRALSEFIKDTYSVAATEATGISATTAGGMSSDSGSASPPQDLPETETKVPDTQSPTATAALDATNPNPPTLPTLLVSDSRPATEDAGDAEASTPVNAKRKDLLGVPVSRPGSSASSTTESLGELEDDIMHMLSSTEAEGESDAETDKGDKVQKAEAEAGAGVRVEPEAESRSEEKSKGPLPLPLPLQDESTGPTLSSTELVRKQQQQYSTVPVSLST